MRHPIKIIHQIEMTSRCNLKCAYCPSYRLKRPKVDMDFETFDRALYWAKHFHRRYGIHEVNLAGIGESTLHPQFVALLAHARSVLGDAVPLVIATNGLLVDDEMAEAMAPHRPRVFLSLHRPEKAQRAFEALKRHGLLVAVSSDAAIGAVNWAGQVDWPVTTPAKGSDCPWVVGGWVVVQATGKVSRCSFDASEIGVFAHVGDDLTKFQTSPYALCATCHFAQPALIEQQEALVAHG